MAERVFRYKSAFDIIGPIMVGPSSSHTAGAVRIGKMAKNLFKHIPQKLIVTFYGSFAETYKGHGTAIAIVAGILGFETNDERIPEAISLAEAQGINLEFLVSQKKVEHANTVNLDLIFKDECLNLTAISIGGGSVQLTEINCHSTVTSPQRSGFLVRTSNPHSVVLTIKRALSEAAVTQVQTFEEEAVLFVDTASEVSQAILQKIRQLPEITTALSVAG